MWKISRKKLRNPENKNETVDLKFYSPLNLEGFMLCILAEHYLPFLEITYLSYCCVYKHSENIVLTSSFYYFNPTPSIYAYLCIVL